MTSVGEPTPASEVGILNQPSGLIDRLAASQARKGIEVDATIGNVEKQKEGSFRDLGQGNVELTLGGQFGQQVIHVESAKLIRKEIYYPGVENDTALAVQTAVSTLARYPEGITINGPAFDERREATDIKNSGLSIKDKAFLALAAALESAPDHTLL